MNKQIVYSGNETYTKIENIISSIGAKKIMVVCGKSYHKLGVEFFIKSMKIDYIVFDKIEPNPKYEVVVEGVNLFKREQCDCIVAIGGGSIIDVAKCIKLYTSLDGNNNYLSQKIIENTIPIIAIPTTAGTGSEATRFAVIYYEGEKQSVAHDSILPQYVILDSSLLKSLPDYQRKVTMLDALCHAIESVWSIYANELSMEYAYQAIKKIMKYMEEYLGNTQVGNENMLIAANLAGKAINITKTTACHAMSYKLTSIYGIAHGHAVALCVPEVWRYIRDNIDRSKNCIGSKELNRRFKILLSAFECENDEEVIQKIQAVLDRIGKPISAERLNIGVRELAKSVNVERLENTPVDISEDVLAQMYKNILKI